MGCTSSKAVPQQKSRSGSLKSNYTLNNNKSFTLQLASRVNTIESTRTVTLGRCKARYAYMTQRGYYPDDLNKPNQDALSVNHKFANIKKDAWFSVYDGHGRNGDRCSQFAAKNLPETCSRLIEQERVRSWKKTNEEKNEYLKKNKDEDKETPDTENIILSKEEIHEICRKGHIDCNENLHQHNEIDDSLSGTTSISAYFYGPRSRITICNVGDSRAILGQTKAAEPNASFKKTSTTESKESKSAANESSNHIHISLKAFPLSRDQTPYRKDERIRVKKCGARIMSLDQIEGFEPSPVDEITLVDGVEDLELGEEIDEYGDPPRVWAPDGEYPGTAFTRSFGDAVAEELGVNAEPEILTRELSSKDKIIVLASDGVFEFLTNQSVIDICAKFQDPLEACRAVVAEAYELWLQYERRTDDITILCIFLDEIITEKNENIDDLDSSKNSDSQETSNFKNLDFDRPLGQLKRKNIFKDMVNMKHILSSLQSVAKNIDYSSSYSTKTPLEMKQISDAIDSNKKFRNISDKQRDEISKILISNPVEPNKVVIKQGDSNAEYLYFVDYGDFDVIKEDADASPKEDTKEQSPESSRTDKKINVVHSYHGSRSTNAHPSFGELALIHSKPRDATVKATSKGHLWLLPKLYFQKIVMEQNEKRMFSWMLHEVLKEGECSKEYTFSSMTFEEIEEAALKEVEEVMFEEGDQIIDKDSKGNEIYFVVYGLCESKQSKNAKKSFKENMLIGEEILKAETGQSYSLTVTALEKTKCLKIEIS